MADGGVVFGHGVASGDPLVDRIVLWTRVTPPDSEAAATEVTWVVAGDRGLVDVVRSGSVTTDAGRDHTVKVDVGGLEPGRQYHYGFTALGQSSPVGRFRTAATAPDRLRFAFAACAKFNAGHFNAYGNIARRDDLDFVLHLGDYIYEASQDPPPSQTKSPDIGRPFEPREECRTLDAYRTRYRQYRRDPQVRAMHAAHAMIATVDDHEFADNAWGGGSTEHHPDEHGPYEARKAAAYQAWTEWMPARRWATSPLVGVWRSFAFGDLARLVLLDERSNRSFPRDGGPEEARTQLGEAQFAWLRGELDVPGTAWSLIGSPGVLADTWNPGLGEDEWVALRKLKLMDLEVDGPDDDQWDWYLHERDEVLRALGSARSGRPVVMSGDIHCGLAADLSVDGAVVAEQVVTFSVTSQNLDDKLKRPPRAPESRAVSERLCGHVDEWHWFDPDSHGYVLAEVDAGRYRAEWWAAETIAAPSAVELCVATAEIVRATGAVTVTSAI